MSTKERRNPSKHKVTQGETAGECDVANSEIPQSGLIVSIGSDWDIQERRWGAAAFSLVSGGYGSRWEGRRSVLGTSRHGNSPTAHSQQHLALRDGKEGGSRGRGR